MRNLAGHKDADEHILEELMVCRITAIVGDVVPGEVPTHVTGRLGGFAFRRLWYYYSAKGRVPLAVAIELYADPLGRRDIRVDGHCGNPPPASPWVSWTAADGREIRPTTEEPLWRRFGEADNCVFHDNPASIGGRPYIDTYHIDSEAGLRLFADTIRKHGLDNA